MSSVSDIRGSQPWLAKMKEVVKLSVLENVFDSDKENLCFTREMSQSVWQLMPGELLFKVLLFLPVSSQARFQTVCKHWRQVITSAAFQQETGAISFFRGNCACLLELEWICNYRRNPNASKSPHRLKTFRLRVPESLMVPPYYAKRTVVCTQSGLPLVAVAWFLPESFQVRCWIINLASRPLIWRQLPQLMCSGNAKHVSDKLRMWLVQAEEGSTDRFQAFLMHPGSLGHRSHFYIYSSASEDWRSVAIPLEIFNSGSSDINVALVGKGEYVVAYTMGWLVDRFRLQSEATPAGYVGVPPERQYYLLSNCDSSTVFAYGSTYPVRDVDMFVGLFLYKMDLSGPLGWPHRREWECLFKYEVPHALRQVATPLLRLLETWCS